MDPKFSYDTYMEIVSRTSLKTLDTMRCISKDFEKLTYDSYLLNLHKKRNNIVSGFLVLKSRNGWEYTNEFAPAPESNTLDLRFLPRNARIVASSDQGLIVFESPHPRFHRHDCYHICKPATKQVLELPNPKTKYLTKRVAMIVMGSKPLHYKIIRLSEPKPNIRYGQYTSYRCEVFDSKAWEWRLQDHLILPYCVFLSNEQPITTSGSIYMLLTNKEVLKFDAYTEKWTTFSSPVQTGEDHGGDGKLVKYQGKLGFAYMTPNLRSLEIWVLSVDELWEKLHVFDMQYSYLGETIEAIYDSDTRVVLEHMMTLVFSRFRGGDYISKIRMFKGGYYPCRIFPFRSDFEPAHSGFLEDHPGFSKSIRVLANLSGFRIFHLGFSNSVRVLGLTLNPSRPNLESEVFLGISLWFDDIDLQRQTGRRPPATGRRPPLRL
ncbi:hypothetical protein LXL04_033299 [Taraxacum kok-saghyz]